MIFFMIEIIVLIFMIMRSLSILELENGCFMSQRYGNLDQFVLLFINLLVKLMKLFANLEQ